MLSWRNSTSSAKVELLDADDAVVAEDQWSENGHSFESLPNCLTTKYELWNCVGLCTKKGARIDYVYARI